MNEDRNQPQNTLPERRIVGRPAQTMAELDKLYIEMLIDEMAERREDIGFDRAWLEKDVPENLRMGVESDIALSKCRITEIRKEIKGLRHGKRPV